MLDSPLSMSIPCLSCDESFLVTLEDLQWLPVTCPSCGRFNYEVSQEKINDLLIDRLQDLEDEIRRMKKE